LNLFELTQEFCQIRDLASDDAIPAADLQVVLDEIQGQLDRKVLAIGAIVLGLDAEAAAVRETATRLAARAHALERRAAWLRGYTIACMRAGGMRSAKDAQVRVGLRSTAGAVVVESEAALPGWAQETIVTIRTRKADILDALRKGIQVPGARLEVTDYLEIR